VEEGLSEQLEGMAGVVLWVALYSVVVVREVAAVEVAGRLATGSGREGMWTEADHIADCCLLVWGEDSAQGEERGWVEVAPG